MGYYKNPENKRRMARYLSRWSLSLFTVNEWKFRTLFLNIESFLAHGKCKNFALQVKYQVSDVLFCPSFYPFMTPECF